MASIFFLCIPTNTDLLKAEILESYKYLKISFNVQGFITCLCDDSEIANTIKAPPSISLYSGISATRSNDLEPTVWIDKDKLFFSGEKNFVFIDKKENLWQAQNCDLSELINLNNIELPKDAPSRAWLKIAQAFQYFKVDRSNYKSSIEIGSSPGGASYFLINQKIKVLGIDPGEMSPSVNEMNGFKHLKKPIQDVRKDELPASIDILAVDTNLSAQQSVKESLRIANFYQSSLKEVFLTIKLPLPKMISQLEKHKRALRKLGFKARIIQLPSHHREVLLYGSKN